MAFLQNACGFFKDFFGHDRFMGSINATFVVLIPKKWDAEDIKDF